MTSCEPSCVPISMGMDARAYLLSSFPLRRAATQFIEEIEQEREVRGRLGSRSNWPVEYHESFTIGGNVDVYRVVWLKRSAWRPWTLVQGDE